jgi:hypothetical protein
VGAECHNDNRIRPALSPGSFRHNLERTRANTRGFWPGRPVAVKVFLAGSCLLTAVTCVRRRWRRVPLGCGPMLPIATQARPGLGCETLRFRE